MVTVTSRLTLCLAIGVLLSVQPAHALEKIIEFSGTTSLNEDQLFVEVFDADGDGNPEILVSPDGGLTWEARTLSGSLVFSFFMDGSILCPQCTDRFEWWIGGFGDVDPSAGREAVLTWFGEGNTFPGFRGARVVSVGSGQTIADIAGSLKGVVDFNGDGTDEIFMDIGLSPDNRLEVWGHPSQTSADPIQTGARSLQLFPSFPNPASRTSQLSFRVERAGDVDIRIYDARGRLVRTLDLTKASPGQHHVAWDGRDARGRSVGAGTYYYEIRSGGVKASRKMTIVR